MALIFSNLKKPVKQLALFAAVFFAIKYLLPLLLPFLFGVGVALLAEPAVAFSSKRLKLPRAISAGIGVSITLLLLLTLVSFLGALTVKELGNLAGVLPDIQNTARQGITLLQDWLVTVTDHTPDGVRPLLQRSVTDLFGSSSALVDQVTRRIPGVISGILSGVPDGALGVGTGLLASFMISVRLPRIKHGLQTRMPSVWTDRYLPALRQVRHTVGGWMKAQAKLAGITYLIVTAGFLLLRIPYGPIWAILVALVDAVPVLGTGTVLLPWALIKLLQRQHLQAIGLICTYGASLLTRTTLEPKLVGRHLGLDPLLTLLFLYLGFRFWGVTGMLFAPILAAAVKTFLETADTSPQS